MLVRLIIWRKAWYFSRWKQVSIVPVKDLSNELVASLFKKKKKRHCYKLDLKESLKI